MTSERASTVIGLPEIQQDRLLMQYDTIMATYCVDMNHVYAVGHSSGAALAAGLLAGARQARPAAA